MRKNCKVNFFVYFCEKEMNMNTNDDLPVLPDGEQDFSVLRENGYVYVDKTQFIYSLISVCKKTEKTCSTLSQSGFYKEKSAKDFKINIEKGFFVIYSVYGNETREYSHKISPT